MREESRASSSSSTVVAEVVRRPKSRVEIAGSKSTLIKLNFECSHSHESLIDGQVYHEAANSHLKHKNQNSLDTKSSVNGTSPSLLS